MSDLYKDYEVTLLELTSHVELASKLRIISATVLILFLDVFLGYYLISQFGGTVAQRGKIFFSISFMVTVLIVGLINGKLWQVIGLKIARLFYRPFVREKKELSKLSSLYVKFVEAESEVYFEAQAKDPNFKGIPAMLNLIFSVSLSQIGFFITIMALLLRPLIGYIRSFGPFFDQYEDLVSIFIALAVSMIMLGLYLPMSMILRDSHLRTFNSSTRVYGIPGSSIKGKLDALVGISALTSGWSLFNQLREKDGAFFFSGTSNLIVTFDYLSWIIFILLVSWPIVFPSVLYYLHNHEKTINDFRRQAISEGIPLGISKVRNLNESEKMVFNDFLEVN